MGLSLQIFAASAGMVVHPVQAGEAGVEEAVPAAESRPCHDVVTVSSAATEDEPDDALGTCLDCCLLGSCCVLLPGVPQTKTANLALPAHPGLTAPQPADAHALPFPRPPIRALL